jgi:hypothetical protein
MARRWKASLDENGDRIRTLQIDYLLKCSMKDQISKSTLQETTQNYLKISLLPNKPLNLELNEE